MSKIAERAAPILPEASTRESTLPTGWLFLLVLFLALSWPFKALGTIVLGSIVTDANEICLVFLPLIYAFYPSQPGLRITNISRRAIELFLASLLLVSLTKLAISQASLNTIIRDLRPLVPLFSGLLLLWLGVRVRSLPVWICIFLALLCSYLGSLFFYLFDVTPRYISTDSSEIVASGFSLGRLENMNAYFAVFALAMLMVWRGHRDYRLLTILLVPVCILSLSIGVLTFSRTLLAFYFIGLSFFLFFHFSLKKAVPLFLFLLVAIASGLWAYQTNDRIQAQVQQRILSITGGLDALLAEGYYGSREEMYASYRSIASQYWALGAPGDLPRSMKPDYQGSGGELPVYVTDISVLTIFLSFGLFATISFIVLLVSLIREGLLQRSIYREQGPASHIMLDTFLIAFFFLLMISFNYDALSRGVSVFYLCLTLNFHQLLTSTNKRR